MKTKKELKDEYKRMKFRIGVFQIRNKANGKIFIGSSSDLVAIWNRYKFQLNAGMHQNTDLQNDWKKYGEEQFSYEIVDEIKQDDTKETDYVKEARELERLIIEERQPFDDKGYNKRPV